MDKAVLALKLYNLAAQILVDALQSSGSTIEEVRAAVDEKERQFFDQNEQRIAELRAIAEGTTAPEE
jgi:hypothetical protein